MEFWDLCEELISSLFWCYVYYLLDWLKEQAEAKQKKKEREKKEGLEKLKSAIIISGIVVAVVGAAFAITKKLREKWSHIPQDPRVLEDL